ncbi:WD40 repeat domain-containing protein [Planctomycetota bacterium]
MKIWDVDTGRELLSIDGYDNPIRSVAISPEGNLIAGAGSDNGLIRIWRCATSEEVATWK